MPGPQQITVHVKTPVINCTPKGGHVHAANRDQMQWVCNDRCSGAPCRFTLEFKVLDSQTKVWPFVDPEPTWPVSETKVFTLKNEAIPRYFEYTVRVDGCTPLDPIVIVDK